MTIGQLVDFIIGTPGVIADENIYVDLGDGKGARKVERVRFDHELGLILDAQKEATCPQ